MIAALASLGPWTWAIAGMLLMLVELFAPGLFFIWLGLAALATAALVGLFDLGWAQSALVFAGLAIAAVFAGRALTRQRKDEPDAAASLNAPARDLIGRTLRLDEPIRDGVGRLRIGDTVWRALGPDLPAGETVRITGREGSALTVRPVDGER